MIKLLRAWWAFCIVGCAFGGSSSNSSQTSNTDKRLVVSDQAIGLSSDSSTVNITTSDQGAIKGALDAVKGGTDAIRANYDTLLKGTDSALNGILSLADKAVSAGYSSLDKSQANATAAMDTKQSAGTLDNRTITILGVSAAVAVAAFAMKRKG